MQNERKYSGLIAWFTQNHVAANLLMVFFLLGGYLILGVMNREIFPTIDPKMITVSVSYPGASPDDVEEGITRRIEEAILGVDGIKRVSALSMENMGSVTAELEEEADSNDVYNDIRNEVDGLVDFPPQNAENVVIQQIKPKSSLMLLALSGDVSENMLHDYAESIEQDLLNLPMVNDVKITGGRAREVTIEISSEMLEKYNLSHAEVGEIIAGSSQNFPAGFIDTSAGSTLLRVQERRYYADEFADIIIRALPDGTVLRLKDIATLRDGFDDSHLINEYNGKPSLTLSVTRNARQDVIMMEDQINQYLKTLDLPEGLSLDVKKNSTNPLKDRTNLMIKNALSGFVLLFICLLLFLDLKLAFWISMGVPISFLGGLMISYFLGVNMNMITLFALIIVIGVVVDDAIIIGENIFYEQENPQPQDEKYDAVIRGVYNVISPATVGVMTTILAFIPLLFTTGTFGQILQVIPIIVICILFISLVEVYFILPAHLSSDSRWSRGALKDIQKKVDEGLAKFTQNTLEPLVRHTMRYRYATMAGVLCFILVGFLAVSTGMIRVVFFPTIESKGVTAILEMPIDTAFEDTQKNAEKIYDALQDSLAHFATDTPIYNNITMTIGQNTAEAGPGGAGSSAAGNHLARVNVQLVDSDDRDFSALAFEKYWRDATGGLPGVRNLEFQSSLLSLEPDIQLELSHRDSSTLEGAAKELLAQISLIEGVTTLKENVEKGKKEYDFEVSPAGYAAGLSPALLGVALRSAFNGYEVTRVQRGRNEVRIMVRLPEAERETQTILNNFKIKLPNGERAALRDMSLIKEQRSYSQINSVDGRRIIALLGDIDETIRTTDEVMSTIDTDIMPDIMQKYPDLRYSYEGKTRERADDLSSLKTNTFLAIFVIFAILAVQLRGYIAPFVIVANIPLGVVGAIYSHWILG
ncbi:MAG: efflux RND transporter permease subunit, partial [Pseudomonadota bacterium]